MIQTFEVEQTYGCAEPGGESLDVFLDCVLDEFARTHPEVEADYLANLRTHAVTWTISVDADDKLAGLSRATEALRDAVSCAQQTSATWVSANELQGVTAVA